ncbi:hypothetical protein ACIG0C_36470 [Kitasatospora aureofaciens]|uniref:Uncharacterized protein n=1 Tax=Kitasatospora aureofaciens TaxID=1894 RepID=A0A8H9I0E0_KITAU|nr:hypothetical protein [Kitasatospora aureofaciens]GGV08636.1 hypothetical protein GCM10010502_74360 [Kitasatospora aureofaciens]
MTTRTSRRRSPAPRASTATRRSQAPAQPERHKRPAWRDPGPMLGSVLSDTGAGAILATLAFLAQHVEVTWR